MRACCAAVLLVCVVLLTGSSFGAEKVTKLEFASFLPVQDPMSVAFLEWCKEVEKRTNGRVAVTYHPGGTLVPMAQTYDSVVNGMADIGFSHFGYTMGRFPLMELLDLPTGLKTSRLSARLAKDFVARFKPKELQDVKVLFLCATSPAVIHSKKPINKLEDMKGLKIRQVGGPMVTALKLLGAVPIVIPTVDVYDSASKGVIDGTYSPWLAVVTFKWGEVLPCSVLNYRTATSGTQFVVMNKNKWDALPSDIQQIIDKLSDEYWEKMADVWDQSAQDSLKTLTAAKHAVVPLSGEEDERWFQKIAPVYETYVKEKSAKGLPAAEAVNFVREWVRKNQK